MVHLLLVSPCGLLVGVALGVGVVGVNFAAGGFRGGGFSGWRLLWLAGYLGRALVFRWGGARWGGVMDFRHFSDIS